MPEVRREISILCAWIRTVSHPAQGRHLTLTRKVWHYHSEPDQWEISPVSCKAIILEATPDAGELAEVVQGA
eukprot:2717809-Pleurochrysis_carterae.AAC.1